LFISIRSAASCGQPLHDSSLPRGARTVRGPAAGRRSATVTSKVLSQFPAQDGEARVVHHESEAGSLPERR
jgi:hypothetical protein